jgi:hypothetical protein
LLSSNFVAVCYRLINKKLANKVIKLTHITTFFFAVASPLYRKKHSAMRAIYNGVSLKGKTSC